jgi:hypothetical protein
MKQLLGWKDTALIEMRWLARALPEQNGRPDKVKIFGFIRSTVIVSGPYATARPSGRL